MIIVLEEEHLVKENSKLVIDYLKKVHKKKIGMITGDNEFSAKKVANHLDIDNVVFQAYPEDKKRAVENYQAEGEKVMFIGDGINDSPVLAQADIGVAINCGSDITINAAQIIFLNDNLLDVVNCIRIANKSFQRIKLNFLWAFFYNLLLVPVAMGVLYPFNFTLNPMLAGGAMAMSSISVVLSSLLLKLYKPMSVSQLE